MLLLTDVTNWTRTEGPAMTDEDATCPACEGTPCLGGGQSGSCLEAERLGDDTLGVFHLHGFSSDGRKQRWWWYVLLAGGLGVFYLVAALLSGWAGS